MIYKFLKFTDKQAAIDALASAYPAPAYEPDPDLGEQPQPLPYVEQSRDHFIDMVGAIIGTEGQYDTETGEEITPPIFVDGWHVNLLLPEGVEIPGSLAGAQMKVNPATPSRTVSGVPYKQ